MRKQRMHVSLALRTVAILSAAMCLILGIQTWLIVQSKKARTDADDDYFIMCTDSVREEIAEKQQELYFLAAQLQQNEAVQGFFSETNIYERYKRYQQLSGIVSVMLAYNSRLSTMHIFRIDGECFSFGTTIDFHLWKEVKTLYNMEDSGNLGTRFLLLAPYKGASFSQFVFLTPIFSLTTREKVATLAVFGLCDNYFSMLRDEYVDMWFVDSSGNSYPDNAPEKGDARLSLLYKTDVLFVRVQPYTDLSNRTYISYYTALLLILIGILLYIGWWLSMKLTRPIMTLGRQMDMVCQGKQNQVSLGKGGHELIDLAQEINGLLDTLESRSQENLRVHDRLYQTEIARCQTQFYALRNQVNPHFLFNTMQTIRGMAICAGEERIAGIATNISDIFRYTVREEPEASLREEIAIAGKYMQIVNVRSGGMYTFIADADDALPSCRVMRMMIQPLIENAIRHGFKNMESGARITIHCVCEGRILRVLFEDNGEGFSFERLSFVRGAIERPFGSDETGESSGIGLRNIHQRLRTFYGSRYGIEIESVPGRTVVSITMPFIPEGKSSGFQGD